VELHFYNIIITDYNGPLEAIAIVTAIYDLVAECVLVLVLAHPSCSSSGHLRCYTMADACIVCMSSGTVLLLILLQPTIMGY